MIDNIEWHGRDGAYGTPYKCYCKLCKESMGEKMTLILKDIMEARKEHETAEEKERHLNMTIKVLKEQVEVFRDRIEPTETGTLHTAISVMSHRISELEQKRKQ